MAAVARARRTLEPLFSHLASFLGPTDLHALAHAYTTPRNTTFRLNTLKVDTATTRWPVGDKTSPRSEVLQSVEAALMATSRKPTPRVLPCPFSRNAFMVSHPSIAVKHLAGLPAHKDGRLHFQSWSSMLAPLCVGAQPGWRVLDMCAAPGGKTLMLCEAMRGVGSVVVNEIDAARAARLKRNIDTAGLSDIVRVNVGDGRKLAPNHPAVGGELFDAILLDAPCGGEGIIAMSEPASYKHWSLAWVQKHARLQAGLLAAAHALLKPGGVLTYSTCTLSVEENELVVDGFLERFPDMSIVNLALPLVSDQEVAERYANFTAGFTHHHGQGFPQEMAKALRVFPNEHYEGFFVIRMQKRE
ncbi:hypothetical protein HDU87_003633 [Geranomyces variabilis]|uniref:SAM-dependent MTase RsmB/NOP-type domain-containing protein n=1 Tax=Geranomyces variabilis TaxID=109894 RepID=A0AAD5TKZ6_9FUNG|nr:hypothetical protein HDU87_003633 [Geranomyces variabilis]